MLKQIGNRKNGVTIDQNFIKILENQEFLTSSHLIFFQNVFNKYFSNRRNIFLVDCYFFAEFMPKLTNQLSNDLIDFEKINKIKQQIVDKKTCQSNIISNSANLERNQPIQQAKEEVYKAKTKQKKFMFEIISINEIKQVDEGIFKISQLETLLFQQTLNNDYQKGSSIANYDYAYFPINLGNSHWISVLVYFKEGKIIYQDSLNGYKSDIMAGIERIIKYKCTKNFKWEIQKNTPRQTGVSDCGVFALYALFFLYTRGEVIQSDSYSETFIIRVRQNFVALAKAELNNNLNADQVIDLVNSF
ncbi:unnamed protein product (macronuclear) [Paramecium tetraurelia]|uniref:Ubiquitin-like protease family profile domain-containing protein n=1 Tax=Paramecium tetraurelia TaxID=5888 RepID=A0BUY0_PARTE|nr:uncharacterized protein GSPATT00005593001 [Paramecium tetraurelia]CAK62347.1 unnamed protein product [Paramecium tetraurelia]|eukprot:XP_001429745.1 hypothetical protein (macronuclear) [Paramecium tetraurelia strain d4-2]